MDTREIIYDFIIKYKREHQGHTPTLRQLMDASNLATKSAVCYHLDALHDDGLIVLDTDPGTRKRRNIKIPGAVWHFNSQIAEEATK